jgi:hypothetical protein
LEQNNSNEIIVNKNNINDGEDKSNPDGDTRKIKLEGIKGKEQQR